MTHGPPAPIAANESGGWLTRPAAAAGLLGGVGLLVLGDLALDAGGGAGPSHVAFEALAALLCLVGAVAFLRRWTVERRAVAEALDAAEASAGRWHDEAIRWRAEAEHVLRGLGEAIDRQLRAWELTDAEREVALLLLKGLSLKEVAGVRSTSERTSRQQARAVYRKAGLAGRAELSAFFLEDLLLPPDGGATSGGAS